jgi:hypothetical protein
MVDEVVNINVRDKTSVAVRIYRPDGSGPFPALLGAAPYRFDNNRLPASAQFLWRETGPIEWYVEQGYAYVHMDARGSGRSLANSSFLAAANRKICTTSSNGSAGNLGAAAKLAALASNISACLNGLWARSRPVARLHRGA